jgi:hypothetical protein
MYVLTQLGTTLTAVCNNCRFTISTNQYDNQQPYIGCLTVVTDFMTNVLLGNCISGHLSYRQMSFWVNVIRVNVHLAFFIGQMSSGKMALSQLFLTNFLNLTDFTKRQKHKMSTSLFKACEDIFYFCKKIPLNERQSPKTTYRCPYCAFGCH